MVGKKAQTSDMENTIKLPAEDGGTQQADAAHMGMTAFGDMMSEFWSKEELETFQVQIGQIDSLIRQVKEGLMAWDQEEEIIATETMILKKQKPGSQLQTDATKEAKESHVSGAQEEEIKETETVTMEKQNPSPENEFEEKANGAMQGNDSLQRDTLELQTLTQEEEQQSDINETRAGLEKRPTAEAPHERLRVLEEMMQSLDDSASKKHSSSSETDTHTLRHRFMRLFIPGWRRRYSSVETMKYSEARRQTSEESHEGRHCCGCLASCRRRGRL